MARIKIPVEKLPPPNEDGTHIIRFRVSSEDRNSVSEWSKLFQISSTGQIYPIESDYVVKSGFDLTSITWDTPSIYNLSASASGASVQHNHGNEWKQHGADIFVSFTNSGSANFVYWGRSSDNSFSISHQQFINQYTSVLNLEYPELYDPGLTIEDLEAIRIIIQSESRPAKINPIFQFIDTGNVVIEESVDAGQSIIASRMFT
jgi:hypothetical protein